MATTGPRPVLIAVWTSVRPSSWRPNSAAAGEQEHADVDAAGDDHGEDDVGFDGAEDPAGVAGVGAAVAVADEGGVEVDGVRHDGGAEHPDGEQGGVGPGEARDQPGGGLSGVGGVDDEAGEEPDGDDGEEGGDDLLEGGLAVALDVEQGGGHGDGDDGAGHQREVEEELEGERAADDFGDVGGDGDELGLDPVGEPGAASGAWADEGGQGLAGEPADLGGQVLDEPGHQRGADEDPQQQVLVGGSGGGVGGDVAGVDVGDGGDERRSEEAGAAEQGARVGPRRPRQQRHLLGPLPVVGLDRATATPRGGGGTGRRRPPR